MAFWNYRIVKSTGEETTFTIHEAYYDDDQHGVANPIPHSITERPIAASGESRQDVRWDLDKMLRACTMPVLILDGNEIKETND